ncbi:hypothetical protein LCGC14_1658520, partial [marine sediment metagenome]
MEKKIYFILAVLMLVTFVVAADFTPQGNINLRNVYNITNVPYYNGTDINITGLYYGNGSQMIGVVVSSANSSDFWDSLNTPADITGLTDSQISDTLTIDGTGSVVWATLNTYPSTCTSSQYISVLGDTLTCAAISIAISQITDIANANVNSSDFWDGLNTPADILGSLINNDLNWINWTTVANGTLYLSSNPSGYIDWGAATNGTLFLSSQWNATNTSYYLVTNPHGYVNTTSASDLNNLLTLDWANITNKFITAVGDVYINMVGTTATFNETVLNATGDARYINVDGETSNITTTGNVTGSFIFGDGSNIHGIQHGNLALFLLNNASDISGSKILFTDVGIATSTTLSKAITVTGTEYQNWTTNDGVPNLHELLDGVNEMHLHARTTGSSKDTTLFWRLWQNNTAGNMVLLFTSEESSILTTTLTGIDIHMTVVESALNLSDRLTIQLIANIAGGGANPTVEVQIEGASASRVELVVPGANVGTFVPYLGAINNLNLGAHNFSVDASVLFVDSNKDYVGIGTSSPDSVFHIKADIAGTVGSHPAGQIIIQNPADSVTSNAVITAYESDGSGNPDQQLWYLGSSSSSNSNIILLNRRNALLQFGTSDSTRMTILGNGNVGINTTTPQNTLNVIGDINFTTLIYGNGSQLIGLMFASNDSFYLKTNPFGFYNVTDFDINDYYLKNNPFSFYNSTDFSISDYYLKNNPFGFFNSTNPQTETDPIFTAWDNFTGIPHATPSNGDVTHFSWADEIYDWVIGLGYSTTTGTVTSVAAGNGLDFTTITSTGSVTMGTPDSLTAGTSNAVTATSHTHAVSGFLESLVQDTSPQLGG